VGECANGRFAFFLKKRGDSPLKNNPYEILKLQANLGLDGLPLVASITFRWASAHPSAVLAERIIGMQVA
jgi:hypothetical protein